MQKKNKTNNNKNPKNQNLDVKNEDNEFKMNVLNQF